MNEIYAIQTGNKLEHHGIMGQKWGVRRYQNEDGSLTAAGKARYGKGGDGKIVKDPDINKVADKDKQYVYKNTGNKSTSKSTYSKKERTYELDGEHYKDTDHSYVSKGTKSSDLTKKIDKSNGDWDYEVAEEVNGHMNEALRAYREKGAEAAQKYLEDAFGDVKYEAVIQDEEYLDWGENYIGYSMRIYGNDYVYNTTGEEDYYDEDYFEKRK